MPPLGVLILGAVMGAVLGGAAALRLREWTDRLTAVLLGSLLLAALLGGLVSAGSWAADYVRVRGVPAGILVGLPWGAVAGYLLGGVSIAFFAFLFGPADPWRLVLRRSFGHGAWIIGATGAFFGALSGAVIGSLKGTGLL
ncbi:MAG: hypothetical protein FJW39_07630 [Acidobacteria bacterium]|nr:hypothetical protein [Acidobacteriota bacterium]